MTTASEQSTAKGWTADDSTFGARLALIRQRMAWGNVREAATACGVPTESWRSWERDGVVPRRVVEISKLISERTGCDFGWLLAGPELRGGEAGPRNTHGCATVPAGRADHTGRAKDNRPPGRPAAATAPGIVRTAYVPRPKRS